MTNLELKEAEELDEFLHTHERAHFLQSPEWARVKSRVGTRNDNSKR